MAFVISKNDTIKENKSVAISDGSYNACVVGYLVSKKTPFDEPDGEPYDAIRFALQFTDDEGANRIIQTKDMRIVLSEKSNLFKQLSGWCKSTSPTDLWERLERAGFMDANGNLEFDKFFGKPVQLMIAMKASKKDASKLFPEIQFTTPKKGQAFTPQTEAGKLVPIWLSDFITDEEIVSASALEGFEWKRYEKKEETEEQPKPDRKSFTKINTPAPTQEEASEEVPSMPAPATEPATPKASQRLVIRKRGTATPNVEGQDDNGDMPF